MGDPDDFFDDDLDDDLVLAYIEQEQSPIKAEHVAVSLQRSDVVRSPTAKRERKRSQSDEIADNDGRSVRNMKPRVEAAVIVRLVDTSPILFCSRPPQQIKDSKLTPRKVSHELPAAKKQVDDTQSERDVMWPPSQTFSADAIKAQASKPKISETKPRIKSEPEAIVVKGSKGKTKASAINIDIKRDQEGNVTENGKKEITKHLLRTLGQKHNPITNSDLYTRYVLFPLLRYKAHRNPVRHTSFRAQPATK
jgi:hypothetical protein